ncbi:aspartyl protease family protein [uncultured Sphingomonas sp.]|uniref:retropepsin-like aspartic protease n=1 Tax=uncultured Sphingomonas sp. TaxID=158754 RepID=UPI0035C9D389
MRRLSILPFLLFVCAAATLSAAAPPPDAMPLPAGTSLLARDAEARWVPFTLTPGDQMRFDLSLDGRPVSAILDTGVSYSVLARRYATEQHLAVRAVGSATAIGGVVAIGWVDTRAVALGGLVRSGGGVAVADLPAIATGGTAPVDMLVGRDLVGTAALDIDYAGRRFRLIPTGRMPFAGFVAPLAISPERQVYVTRVTLAGHVLSPMIVDTGDGSAITVSQPAWREAVPASIRTTTAIAYGLAGPITIELAIVPEVRVGDLVAREVEVRAEARGGFSEAIGVAGRIGSGFLQHCRVLMDPVAGRMVLSPGPDADMPPQRSTSGLLMTLEPGRLKVIHVMRGGPAEAAGWHAGDLICSVDGQPIDAEYVARGMGAWSAGTPGRTVRLGQCDGPVRLLTLARFY